MSVEEKIKDIIVDKLKVEADDISPDKHFVRDLGADSLDLAELVMELEGEFDIEEIPEEESQKLETVGDAISYIQEKTGE